jgi:predicted membrane protein
MQAQQAGVQSISLGPPIGPHIIIALVLIIFASMIELIPQEYHGLLTNPIIFLVGMFLIAGLASINLIPLAFAVAFLLVNLLRIMPKKSIKSSETKIINPGIKEISESKESKELKEIKEGFVIPSGTIDWVNNKKKWFVEKVLMEKPIGIQEKEVSTYPVQA